MTSLVSFSVWAFNEAQLKNFTTFGALLPIVIGLIIFKFAVSAMVRSIVLIVAPVMKSNALNYPTPTHISPSWHAYPDE